MFALIFRPMIIFFLSRLIYRMSENSDKKITKLKFIKVIIIEGWGHVHTCSYFRSAACLHLTFKKWLTSYSGIDCGCIIGTTWTRTRIWFPHVFVEATCQRPFHLQESLLHIASHSAQQVSSPHLFKRPHPFFSLTLSASHGGYLRSHTPISNVSQSSLCSELSVCEGQSAISCSLKVKRLMVWRRTGNSVRRPSNITQTFIFILERFEAAKLHVGGLVRCPEVVLNILEETS